MFETAVRYSGILLLVGSVFLGIGIVMASFSPVASPPSIPISVFLLISSILVVLALPGMYIRQANPAGAIGLVGHALLEVGVTFILAYAAAPLLYPSLKEPPGESTVAFVLGIALVLGLLLSSIATIRAGVFPRWSGILLLAATLGFFFDFFVAEFLPPIAGQVGTAFFGSVLAAALAWIGISIWTI